MSNIDRALIFIFLSGIPWTLHAGNNYFLCNTSKGTLSLTSFGETLIYEMNSQHGNKFQFISDGPMYSGFFIIITPDFKRITLALVLFKVDISTPCLAITTTVVTCEGLVSLI